MPTPIPSGEKTCALSVIKATACDYYSEFNTYLVNIEDIPKVIFGYLNIFIGNPTLLINFLSCFVTPTELESVGIYINKTDADTITDPLIVVNSVLTTLNINNTEDPSSVLIGGITTQIGTIAVTKNIGNLNIFHKSVVGVLDVDVNKTVTNLNLIGYAPQWFPQLDYITTTSPITVINVQSGILGETTCKDTSTACADNVTTLVANNLTTNSLELSWSDPSGSIGSIIQYRLTGTNEYFFVGSKDDGVNGNKVAGLPKFLVKGLKPDTFYDFIVYNICSTGIKSAGTTLTVETKGDHDVIIVTNPAYAGPNPIVFNITGPTTFLHVPELHDSNFSVTRSGQEINVSDWVWDNTLDNWTPTIAMDAPEWIMFTKLS